MGLFNPDGSLRISGALATSREEKARKMAGRCMAIRKDVVRTFAPKECRLWLELSPAVTDTRFIKTILEQLEKETPMSLVGEGRSCSVRVGTHFHRCSDCTRLCNEYREFLPVIMERGNCPYEGRAFTEEDYFE